MPESRHPLAAFVDACSGLAFSPLPTLDLAGLRHGAPEAGEYWLRADLLAAQGSLGPVYDKVTALHGPGHRLPAVVRFQRSLMRDPIFLVAAASYLTGRAPLLDREQLWYPWHTDASLGTPLVTGLTVAVLADDPAADHPRAVVAATPQERDRLAATHLVDTLAPLVEALHEHTRLGVRTLWGWVADSVCFYMLNPARYLGHDARAAWDQGLGLVEAMQQAGARLRSRPRLFPFQPEHPGGTWGVRGTCCFDYKCDTKQEYCTTCPLLDDGARTRRLLGWLDEPAATS